MVSPLFTALLSFIKRTDSSATADSSAGTDNALEAIRKLVLKEENNKEETLTFLAENGSLLLRSLLERSAFRDANPNTRSSIHMLFTLTLRTVPLDDLSFLCLLVPEILLSIDVAAAKDYATDLVTILETYCQTLILHKRADLPYAHMQNCIPAAAPADQTTEGVEAEASDSVEDSDGIKRPRVRPRAPEISVVDDTSSFETFRAAFTALLESAVARQMSQLDAADGHEGDCSSPLLRLLSLFLLFPTPKRFFADLNGMVSLASLAAQTTCAAVASAILTAMHSCIFNIVDIPTDNDVGSPVSLASGSKKTLFDTIMPQFVSIQPQMLIESILEKIKPDEELDFSIMMMYRDTLGPETPEMAAASSLGFLCGFLRRVRSRVVSDRITVHSAQPVVEAVGMRVQAALESILKIVTFAKDSKELLGILLFDEKDFVPLCLTFLCTTRNPDVADKICSSLAICASYSCQNDCNGIVFAIECPTAGAAAEKDDRASSVCDPLSVVMLEHLKSLLSWVSIYGATLMDSRLNMATQCQHLEDACLSLVWIVESMPRVSPHADGGAEPPVSQRDKVWKTLSVQKEAHGILLLATALGVVEGLVPTLTGLLSLLSTLLSVDGFFVDLLNVFHDKKAEITAFLVDLCIDLSAKGAFAFVVCNSILKGVSTVPEAVRLVPDEKMAAAILPLGFSDDDNILLRILNCYETVPPMVQQSCDQILQIMSAIDKEEIGAGAAH